jgi:hypothetical protein
MIFVAKSVSMSGTRMRHDHPLQKQN